MRIVHFTNWAPRQSGMYESTKDQIKYERRSGLESDLCLPQDEWKDGRDVIDDGWLIPISWERAKGADVFVLHASIPKELKDAHKGVSVAILHGPNEHMVLKEWTTGRKVDAFNTHITILWSYDATVAINQHEYDIMKLYDEKDRLHYIPNSIDLERYQGEKYAWEYINRPAICSFDVPRLEKLPMNLIWAMPKVAEKIPDARLNLFSLTLEPIGTWRNIFCRSKLRKLENLCENIQLENNNLRPFMLGADIGFNNNVSGIASRVSMELMAMGVPVISYGGDYTDYIAKIWDLNSIAELIERCWKDIQEDPTAVGKKAKKYAARNFDRKEHVKKYVQLYENLLRSKKDG